MLERLIRFAPVYRAARERTCGLREISNCAITDLVTKPYSAIRFATTMLHEKVGTSDLRVRQWHRDALDATLGGELSDESFAHAVMKRDFADKVWQNFLCLAADRNTHKRRNRFEGQTRGAVKELLDRLREASQANVFKWIMSCGEPENARQSLDDLSGIGPKIASFVLREVAVFCRGWQGRIDQDNGWCFQPVDRWVLRWCKSIWLESGWPDERKISEPRHHRLVAQRIAWKFSTEEQARAMDFNMGAWFVGAQFEKILAVHGMMYIGTEPLSNQPADRLRQMTTRLDPHRVIESLRVSPAEF
jgi:hypothetical protein